MKHVCSTVLQILTDVRHLQNVPLASHIMRHPELADAFELIADQGHDGFYKGQIAQGRF